jgi:hypothetical protein
MEREAAELWASRQAADADFGDERLNQRMGTVLADLVQKPADSIPQACGGAARAKAVYRFLGNPRVRYDKIIAPIAAATARDCAGQPVVYAVQDTTSFNYSNLSQTKGLGRLSGPGDCRGLHLHTTLALSADGTALGVLDAQCWSRPPQPAGSKSKDGAPKPKKRPFAERESYKWMNGLNNSRAVLQKNLPAERRPRLVHVMDREGDIHEILQAIAESDDGAILRCDKDRVVEGSMRMAHAAVRQAPLLGIRTVDVPAQAGQSARQAQLQVRAVTVTISPDRKHAKDRRPCQWTLVEAWEANPPAGAEPLASDRKRPAEPLASDRERPAEPILWRLWTTEKVRTLAEANTVIDGYMLRWRVEEYHLILKSGCTVEKLELETADRLANAIALYAPVAVMVLTLRDLSRTRPDAPCTIVLSDLQWRVLHTFVEKRAPAANQTPPTIRQATLWIGRLGGHLGRKCDGMPGVRTLWRGWRDLTLLTFGYQAARL